MLFKGSKWGGFGLTVVFGLIMGAVNLYVYGRNRTNRKVIETALSLFAREIDPENKLDFRCLLWRVSPDKETMTPACNYVPNGPAPSCKTLATSKGVTGCAARTGNIEAEFLYQVPPSSSKFEDVMVKEWGFSKEEAQKLRKDRVFFAGVPVKHNGEVLGVVYADAKDYPGTEGATLEERTKEFQDKTEQLLPFLELLLASQIKQEQF